MRWRLRLEEYDFEIKYKKGSINSNADALSRIYAIEDELEEAIARETRPLTRDEEEDLGLRDPFNDFLESRINPRASTTVKRRTKEKPTRK